MKNKWKCFNLIILWMLFIGFRYDVKAEGIYLGKGIKLTPAGISSFTVNYPGVESGGSKPNIPFTENTSILKLELSKRFGYYKNEKKQFHHIDIFNKSLKLGIDRRGCDEQFKIKFEYNSYDKDISYLIEHGNIRINPGKDEDEGYPVLSLVQRESAVTKIFIKQTQDMPEWNNDNDVMITNNKITYALIREGSRLYVPITSTNIDPGKLKIRINGYDYDCSLSVGNLIEFKNKQKIFFDCNHLYDDLKRMISKKRKMEKEKYYIFYYYESDTCEDNYLIVRQDGVDEDKAGKCPEKKEIEYYLKIILNIRRIFGKNFADEIIIVSRYGEEFSDRVNKALKDMRINTNVIFRPYMD